MSIAEAAEAREAALREALILLMHPWQGRYRNGDPPERSLPAALTVADLLQASRALDSSVQEMQDG